MKKLYLLTLILSFCLVACKEEEIVPVPTEIQESTVEEDTFSVEDLPEVKLDQKTNDKIENDVTGNYDETETSVVGTGASTSKSDSLVEVIGGGTTETQE